MKRFLGAAVAALVGIMLAGCATKGDARNTAMYQQNEELNRPHWVGGQFTTVMNKDNFYWGGSVDESGWFTSGEAKYSDVKASTNAADLDGKAKIAAYVKDEIITTAKEESSNEGADGETQKAMENFVATVSNVKISGIMRVDRYIAEDGTVYVLMYVPESQIKKAIPADSPFAQKVMDKYLEKLDSASEE